MKKYKKFLIILFCIIMIIIIFSLGVLLGKKEESAVIRNDGINTETDIITDEIGEENIENTKYVSELPESYKENTKYVSELLESYKENTKYVSGLLASYKYIDRDLELEYFYKLDNTSTYEQIFEEIGESNGQVGSGLIYKYYEIDDNLYVVIYFSGSENIVFDRLKLIMLCTQDEVLDTIYPR